MTTEMQLTKEHVQEYLDGAYERYLDGAKVRSLSTDFFEALNDYIAEWGPDSIQIVDEDEE